MRRTKIIATVGPACDNDGTIEALIMAGVDIFRLNYSHGTRDSQAQTFHRIRGAAARAGRQAAILQDLGGPKIRTGLLEGGTPIQMHDCTSNDAVHLSIADQQSLAACLRIDFGHTLVWRI